MAESLVFSADLDCVFAIYKKVPGRLSITFMFYTKIKTVSVITNIFKKKVIGLTGWTR